jgi:hypothetical protein
VNYAIIWPDAALEQLADAYLAAQADSRGDEFNQAVDAMEAILVRDPANQGESRSGPYRVVFDLPASLHFRVDETEHSVIILGVGYHP